MIDVRQTSTFSDDIIYWVCKCVSDVCSFSVQWVYLFVCIVFEILLLALMQLLITRKNQCLITKILGFNALISIETLKTSKRNGTAVFQSMSSYLSAATMKNGLTSGVQPWTTAEKTLTTIAYWSDNRHWLVLMYSYNGAKEVSCCYSSSNGLWSEFF